MLPEDLAARLARMRKVAQDRECKLLERGVALDDGLEDRDRAGDGRFFLSVSAQSAQVEERVDDVVLDLL